MWFNKKDLINFPIIKLKNIKGYVLPHASTEYTGHIISHTLRFKPQIFFTKVCILFSPVHPDPNVTEGRAKYFHEYYVVQKSFDYICRNFWDVKRKLKYISYNIQSDNFDIDLDDTLIIISADFSHFLPLKKAIYLENCAAHSILQKYLKLKCCDVIDTKYQFERLYEIIPESWMLQWIGRTRSPGSKGVGYLSFLIRDPHEIQKPDGLFVTAYDTNMQQRECLGVWFNEHNPFTHRKLMNKIIDVISKAQTTSRLTNGEYLSIPLYGYSISYLYKDRTKKFIRGWHGIKTDAFYLPEVFLEHTFNNGAWIDTNHTVKEWPQDYKFDLSETLEKLSVKATTLSNSPQYSKNYKLYYSQVTHHKLN